MNVKTKTQPLAEITVSDADPISLTVTIGNAKMGGSLVKFTDHPEVILAQGGVQDLLLGNGGDVKGRTLSVTTNILDSNMAPRMVAKHQFSNAAPGAFKLSDKVDNAGDVFSWETTYLFK